MLLTISLTHILPEASEHYDNYLHSNEIDYVHFNLVYTLFVLGFMILLFFDSVVCRNMIKHDHSDDQKVV